jgi:hypothetical protein
MGRVRSASKKERLRRKDKTEIVNASKWTSEIVYAEN